MSKTKTILVTGTSSGFGSLITRTLLGKGYIVFATMRGLDDKNEKRANELRNFAEGKSGILHLIELDVTDTASVAAAIRQVLELEDRIDIAVNNAGFGAGGFCEAFTVDQFQRIFDVNVFGVQRVSRAVLPSMRKHGSGLLINISSVMGRIVLPFAAPYTATKYALEGLSESYRYELSGTGVDVTIVEPGGFGTGFRSNVVNPADAERMESYGPLTNFPKKMWAGLEQRLNSENAPNPQAVADAVLKLIETPAGQRPLRTVVDPMTGGEAPSSINQATEQIQALILESMDMADLVSVKEEG